MNEETKKVHMPDEIVNLLMEYTRNSHADVMRFIGAAEQCGYTFTRAALSQPAQGDDSVIKGQYWLERVEHDSGEIVYEIKTTVEDDDTFIVFHGHNAKVQADKAFAALTAQTPAPQPDTLPDGIKEILEVAEDHANGVCAVCKKREAEQPDTGAEIDDYIDGYTLESDDGSYTPTENERFLIRDCVYGLLEYLGPTALTTRKVDAQSVDVDLTKDWPEPPSFEYALYVATHSQNQSREMAQSVPENKRSYWNGEANAYETMKGVLQEAFDHLKAQTWQPIETAPKDGTDIYATCFTGQLWCRPSVIYFEPVDNRGWLCSQTHRPVSIQPTRWQPLPSDPAADDREA